MHLQSVWPQAVVVYPQGLDSPTPLDPSGLQPGWQFKSGDSNGRELKLFDAMVATLKQRYRIDPRRIYTSGFSNGAILATCSGPSERRRSQPSVRSRACSTRRRR